MDDWQLDRMRRALRLLASQNRPYTDIYDEPESRSRVSDDAFRNLAEAIEDLTGVSMGSKDRLRQFARGRPVKGKEGAWHFSEMKTEAQHAAIRDFLTDPDDPRAPLQPMELRDFLPDLQAPFYFLEFLNQKIDFSIGLPLKLLVGHYVAERIEEGHLARYFLTLEKPAKQDGLLHAFMFEESYHGESVKDVPDNVDRYRGWAVMSHDDRAFFFMKSEAMPENHHLLLLDTDRGFPKGERLERFVALWPDAPLGLGFDMKTPVDVDVRRSVHQEIESSVLLFRRATPDD